MNNQLRSSSAGKLQYGLPPKGSCQGDMALWPFLCTSPPALCFSKPCLLVLLAHGALEVPPFERACLAMPLGKPSVYDSVLGEAANLLKPLLEADLGGSVMMK